MNTLTKNRILQKGDEYRDNGTWKPVADKDFGLQVMFTPYKEVRRPSEKPPKGLLCEDAEAMTEFHKSISQDECPRHRMQLKKNCPECAAEKAISPDSGERPAAKAEKEKTPLPLTGDIDNNYKPAPKTETEKAIEKAKVIGASTGVIKIKFPKSTGKIPHWTGRNGTFNGYGVGMTVFEDYDNTSVMMQPIGKRGYGNCLIEFPTAIIPQMIDWLAQVHKKTPK
jgi:hypothetical protein